MSGIDKLFKAKKVTTKDAYKFGFDCGKNGVNEKNEYAG